VLIRKNQFVKPIYEAAFDFDDELLKIQQLYPNQFDYVLEENLAEIYDKIGQASTLKVG